MKRRFWRRRVPRDDQLPPTVCKALFPAEYPPDISNEQAWGRCGDLIAALCAADKCKESIKAGQAEDACTYFVKACSYSVHCLESLRSSVPTLLRILAQMDKEHSQQIKLFGRPAGLQACQFMLLGYQFQALPDSPMALQHLLTDTVCFEIGAVDSHGVSREDICWVYHLGRFKTVSLLIAQPHAQDACSQDFCLNLLEPSLRKCALRGLSIPLSLKVYSMFQQLQAYRLESQQPEEDFATQVAPDLKPGRGMSFVERYLDQITDLHPDPAALMHLLLQSMYIALKDCNAKPDSDTQERLIRAANQWHELYDVLRSITAEPYGNLWHNVRDRMQAAMLLLGCTFPLRECLNGHILVDTIEKTHMILQAQLERQRPQDQTDLQTQHTEPVTQQSNHADTGSTQNCPRCRRRMWREEDVVSMSEQLPMQFYAKNDVRRPIPCSKCHAVAYCSSDCMQLGKADHKANCKRNQLKNKLAARQ